MDERLRLLERAACSGDTTARQRYDRLRQQVARYPIGPCRRVYGWRLGDITTLGALENHIRQNGLINPIHAIWTRGEYYVFDGCLRVVACENLGWKTIACYVRGWEYLLYLPIKLLNISGLYE